MRSQKTNAAYAIGKRIQAAQKLPVNEDIAFGLDIGIASCGWAVINKKDKKILGMGVHCFDPAENTKNKVLKNAERREKRGQRRVIHRRAQRMKNVREVIRNAGLLADPSHEFFQGLGKKDPARDPWKARVDGLDRLLTEEESAAALIHIAKHRGFQSNSKSDRGENAPKDTQKALSAIHETEGLIKKGAYRTFGELILKDPVYAGRRRNREGNYSHTAKREWTKKEAEQIIRVQREKGARWANEEFEKTYVEAAFCQRPLQSSEALVGKCRFEKQKKRTAQYAYSFEKFRALQKLAGLAVISPGGKRRHLRQNEIENAVDDFGNQKSLTYKALKKMLKLADDERFEQVLDDKKAKRDITGNTRGMCPGSYLLRKNLNEENWKDLIRTPEKLDSIAEILTFNESLKDICERFGSLDLSESVRKTLMDATEAGEFSEFKGAGHISAEAARKMIPHFFNGKAEDRTYAKVCQAAGYDHTADQDGLGQLRNPVVSRSVVKALKQMTILAHHHQCRPGAIHVELLREVGKAAEERKKIEQGLDKRTNEKEKHREELADLMTRDPNTISSNELAMYELLKEQKCCCAYCDRRIKLNELTGNNAQIDHIFPQKRFFDDSFVNKVLACVSCNQKKLDRTPWEWHEAGGFSHEWRFFEAKVKDFGCKREKKKRLLDTNFQKRLDEDKDQKFANRNKVDSSYIARLVTAELRRLYPDDHTGGRVAAGGKTRILARPGPLTAKLRRAWLSKTMKAVFGHAEKTREDDRHHAIDALTVACCDKKLLDGLTCAHQKLEERGQQYKWTPNVEPPWENFAEQAKEAMNGWLVCRTESRRARGAGHEETIRRRSRDGIIYERKSVEKLKESDLERIPDQHNIETLKESLRQYIQAMEQWREEKKRRKKNKNKQDKQEELVQPVPPRSQKGDDIRKIRLKTNTETVRQINAQHMGGKLDRSYSGGWVENTNMFRVDVYHVKEKRTDSKNRKITPGYYLVPVYGWQIMDKKRKTPLNAIMKSKPENKWPEMNPTDFHFALYKDSYVEIKKKGEDGKAIEGYYRFTDRNTGAIGVSLHNKHREKKSGIGVKNLSSFCKFTVDRLGRKYKVKNESWPGKKSDTCPGGEST